MKLCKKSVIIFGASVILILSSSVALADGSVDDETTDVFHFLDTGGIPSVTPNVNKPDVDIDSISYSVNGDQLVLTMTLVEGGNFQSGENYHYWVSYNSTDSNYYMYYAQGSEPFGVGVTFGATVAYDLDPVITVSGNVFQGTFDVLGDTSNQNLWGYAHEYTVYGDTAHEWWGDYAPGELYPYLGLISDTSADDDDDGADDDDDGADDDDDDNGGTTTSSNDDEDKKKGTPGFETISIIIALAVALIILKKKRN